MTALPGGEAYVTKVESRDSSFPPRSFDLLEGDSGVEIMAAEASSETSAEELDDEDAPSFCVGSKGPVHLVPEDEILCEAAWTGSMVLDTGGQALRRALARKPLCQACFDLATEEIKSQVIEAVS